MGNPKQIDVHGILEYLPHRYPFMLVDRGLDYEEGKSIKVIKNVTVNEPFFTGHFPGHPVMPGVLMTEALAQASGILIFLTDNIKPDKDNWFYFAGLDKVRFKRIVEPGDQLLLESTIVKRRLDIWRFVAKATVNGELACSAELLLAKGALK